MSTPQIPQYILDHTAKVKVKGEIAARLQADRDALLDASRAEKDPIKSALLMARFYVASERCERNFAIRCWGHDAKRPERAASLARKLKRLRKEIARAKLQSAAMARAIDAGKTHRVAA